MSLFELDRRASSGDKAAKKVLERERLLPSVLFFKRLIMLILALVFIGVAINLYGIVTALFIGGLVAVCLGPIGKIKTFQRLITKLYDKIEPALLKLVKNLAPVFNFFEDLSEETFKKTSSKEELRNQIEAIGEDIVSESEKTIMLSALQFSNKVVHDTMVPAEKVKFIEAKEVLGPLVLDRLHQTTFGTFPVIKKDKNHIVGVLQIRNLMNTDIKNSLTAEQAMRKKVYYIREDHSLEYALSAFARTKQNLFVVINKERETMGILTLRDLMESLLGRDLRDDFDADDDAKAVANRQPNNRPRGGVDV
jgi:CBS domain containing-hemolysin-like protein